MIEALRRDSRGRASPIDLGRAQERFGTTAAGWSKAAWWCTLLVLWAVVVTSSLEAQTRAGSGEPLAGSQASRAEAEAAEEGAVADPEEPTFRLSRPVQESLAQLQDRWLLLNSAVLQGNERLAHSAVNDLLSNLRTLGFRSAPELGLAMVVRGLEAARQGDETTSELSFELAGKLDPKRAALHFGRSRAAWSNGRYLAAGRESLAGYAAAVRDTGFRRLALRNLLIWSMLSLLISAAVFIALQFATKGARLFKDLRGMLPGAPVAGGVVAILVLLLPFFLPSGWLWVGFVWAVLLWGYVSVSERWVLAFCIVFMGAVPSAFDLLAWDLPAASRSEGRLLDRLEAGQLDGTLLDELADLVSQHPDDLAIQQLLADVHQRLGQDDLARPYYRRVVDAEPLNGPALNNLGVFHARRRERVAAIDFLQAAAEIDDSSAAAGFNLSRLYDQLLEFGNSQRYLRLAREKASDEVERWEQEQLMAVSLNGGFLRIPMIRKRLSQSSWALPRLYKSVQPLVLSIAVLLLAIVVRWLGLLGGGGWRDMEDRSRAGLGLWVRRLVPGLRSAEAGDGGRAFAAVAIPVGIGLWPAASVLGYSLPWGLEPGRSVVVALTGLGLAAFFAVRSLVR